MDSPAVCPGIHANSNPNPTRKSPGNLAKPSGRRGKSKRTLPPMYSRLMFCDQPAVMICQQCRRRSIQPQFLKPVVHFLEMKVERAEFFEFARLEMFCHVGIGFQDFEEI